MVGHILFSSVKLTPNPMGLLGLGLAPIGVLPEYQSRGIGSKLIIEGLEVCQRKGFDFSVVLGAPSYYSRFGFRRASDYFLENEYSVDEEFMVVELRKGVLKHLSGLVKYQPEFFYANC